MTCFEVATQFFHACESAKGWDGCKAFVADDARFSAQCEPLTEVESIQEYADGLKNFCEILAPGSSYDLHASSFDEVTRKALFFATFNGVHTGEGGPIPPTGKETHTHYVYIITMNKESKVQHLQKVWNASWSMRELGWMD
jgi:hypothetical protein